MKTIKRGMGSEADQTRRWRHLVHRHGSNLLGGMMIMVMLYAVVLTVFWPAKHYGGRICPASARPLCCHFVGVNSNSIPMRRGRFWRLDQPPLDRRGSGTQAAYSELSLIP